MTSAFARFAFKLKRDPRVAMRPAFETGMRPSRLQGPRRNFRNTTFAFDKEREVRVWVETRPSRLA